MATPEPMLALLWRSIRKLFTESEFESGIDSYEHEATNELRHKETDPARLISYLEYLYDHDGISDDKLARYRADLELFMAVIDDEMDYLNDEFISQVYELSALFNLASGYEQQAYSDLGYAISLNPTGTWLVSDFAQTWKSYNEDGNSESTNIENGSVRGHSDVEGFHNTWTEDIKGWGYSANSQFNIIRQRVFERDNFKCTWCTSRYNLTVDHIKERHLGGTNDLSNLRTLCKDCHEKRHGHKIFDKEFEVDDDYGFSNKGNKKLLALIEAADSGKGICIEYEDRDKLVSVRVIHPVRIYKSRYIFVNAYCELDKEERVFRLSRMKISSEKRANQYLNKTKSYTSSPWVGRAPFNANAGMTIYSKPKDSKIYIPSS